MTKQMQTSNRIKLIDTNKMELNLALWTFCNFPLAY